MQIYLFDTVTGEFVRETQADPHPLEAGSYLEPCNSTRVPPPDPAEGMARVFQNGAWTLVADHRGETWYRSYNEPVEITVLGDPTADGLFEANPSAPALTEEDFERAIQVHVDDIARSKLYSNGVSLASYVASTNSAWASEASAFIAWRDGVWTYAYTELAEVKAGNRTAPTIEEFLAELAPISWPQ